MHKDKIIDAYFDGYKFSCSGTTLVLQNDYLLHRVRDEITT